MAEFTREAMEKRLKTLTDQSDKMKAAAAPLREKRDAYVQKARATEDAMNAEIKKAETGLADIENERALLARALGSRGI